jgi:hypothetical protein
MATSAASDSDIFKQCLEHACEQTRDVMVQLVQQAVAVMQAKQNTMADMRERILWDDDTRALLQQRELLADRFPRALRTLLDKASATNTTVPKDTQSGSIEAKPTTRAIRFETLELVDDAKVQGQIDHSRLQQAAENACEKELGMLDALVCAARGLKIVQPERNPLRPSTFCTALTDTLADADATPSQRVVWMQQLGALLGPELRKLYQKLVEFLQNKSVQAVGYSANFSYGSDSAVDLVAQGAVQSVPSAVARPPTLPKRERASNTPRLSVGQLRQVLGNQHFVADGAAADSTNNSDTAYSLDDVMRDVQELNALVQQLGPAAKPSAGQAQRVSDAGESELHTSKADGLEAYEEPEEQEAELDAPEPEALGAAAQGALAQDVVRLMMDELCDDMRLLECVRDWVGSLEPALLALANVDNTFLTQASHPARRLLDEVTSRSLGFSSEQSEGFAAFFDPVVAACAQIQPSGITSAQPFVQAWLAVEQAWSQQKSAAQLQREQAQQALVEAEQRNLLAEKIALELTRRDDARYAPIFVKQFMASAWAQVLAKARLDSVAHQEAHEEAHGQAAQYLDVVTSVLWSAVPEQITADKKRLVSIVPTMLAILREGLASIGSAAHTSDAFFAQLMQVHESVLKSGNKKSSVKTVLKQSIDDGTAAKLDENIVDARESPVWLAPQEMRAAGFFNSGFIDSDAAALGDAPMHEAAESDFPSTEPQTSTQDEPQSPVTLPNGAFTQPPPLGAWVEFLSHDKWVRAQLTWASPHGTLYMFTGAAGNPHSMTRRALDKMLSRQGMRSAAEGSFVLGALSAVAQAAQRRSVDV